MAKSAKRTTQPRSFTRTSAFVKDWERHDRAGRFDMSGLKKAMMLIIANDGPLPREYRDHALTGEWRDHRDCHVHGDFLLLYRLERQGDEERVVFVRVGTHSELFK